MDLPLGESIDKTVIVSNTTQNVTLYYKIHIDNKIEDQISGVYEIDLEYEFGMREKRIIARL